MQTCYTRRWSPISPLVGEHPEEGALVDFQRRSSIPPLRTCWENSRKKYIEDLSRHDMRARTAAEQERVEWRKEPVARRQKGTDFPSI
jgi:hypothetical protein